MHPQETPGDQRHHWGWPSLQFIPPLAGHGVSSSLLSPVFWSPHTQHNPGSCLERCSGLLAAPIPRGKSRSLLGSQKGGRFEAAPQQPRVVLSWIFFSQLSPVPAWLSLWLAEAPSLESTWDIPSTFSQRPHLEHKGRLKAMYYYYYYY